MFDVGFAELFLLALIGLMVLGPERLPAAARTIGGLVRKARISWYALRRSIESELASADITEPVKSAGNELKDVARRIEDVQTVPQTERLRERDDTGEGDSAKRREKGGGETA